MKKTIVPVLLFWGVCVSAQNYYNTDIQNPFVPENVFIKKTPDTTPPPHFESAKNRLPQPEWPACFSLSGNARQFLCQTTQRMYDEKSAFYYDVLRNGKFNYVKSIAAYWALLADVVPQENALNVNRRPRNQKLRLNQTRI
jgi:hypothetical protein